MDFNKYFEENKNQYGIVDSEFIVKVQTHLEADVLGKEETIIAGYIRPYDRDGQTVDFMILDGNMVLMLTQEEEDIINNSPEMKALNKKMLNVINKLYPK